MMKSIPSSGYKVLLSRVFFNRFMIEVKYCASGHQRITRRHDYTHDYFSVFSFSPFDPDSETYDDRYRLLGLICFRFLIVVADLNKQGL